MHRSDGNVYKILIGKPDGEKPLRTPGHRWENFFTMDLREIGLEGVDWIHLTQDRDLFQAVVNVVMNFQDL
jgi:hypothetical protein